MDSILRLKNPPFHFQGRQLKGISSYYAMSFGEFALCNDVQSRNVLNLENMSDSVISICSGNVPILTKRLSWT